MTRSIVKKSSTAKAPKVEAPEVEVDDLVEETAESTTEVEYDEKQGTSKFSLVNGTIITLKEPKAKDFVYLSSRMQTAPEWQRSATMAVYYLAHFMIDKVSLPGKKGESPIPTFDEFMDMLEDDDLARVGAAFACFPNVSKRVERLFSSGNSTGS